MTDYDSSLRGTWEADPAHSSFEFIARHAMVTKVRGKFTDFSVTIEADPENVEASSVEVRIRVASLDTSNDQRDTHLRSEDFFNVAQWPEIVFRSTAIEEIDDDAFTVTGDLTIRDVTKRITVPVDFTGVSGDPVAKVTRAGFEGGRRLDRRDFGLEWNVPLDTGGVLVSEKITIEFEVSAVQKSEPTTVTAD
ncbi:YceI family protein [Granulicoccus sp. GXG6511]|uniref:YceI family protein n=1 Tax=Granulicoccus sp. GXG6511 TaxID=3381351 RepID=UPI003D7CBB71